MDQYFLCWFYLLSLKVIKGVYSLHQFPYTVNDYLIDDLGDFNYNTSHISTGLFSYYGGTATYYAKIDYNMDKSTEFDTEDFSEFSLKVEY